MNASSAISTSGLSTWKKNTERMPRLFMSDSAPERFSDASSPPWPSGDMNTWPGASGMIPPSGVSPGHIPCLNRNTSLWSSPNHALSLKHLSVAS